MCPDHGIRQETAGTGRLQPSLRWLALPLVTLLLSACGTTGRMPLPPMTPTAAAPMAARCTAFFPQGRWQLTHAITFHLADGSNGNALGVLIIDGKDLNCALMTVEGLTLFAAHSRADGSLEVLRALPPFDSRGFAEGLIADVRTVFLAPPGIVSTGRLADGRFQCRYTDDQRITDILPDAEGCYQLFTYARELHSKSGPPKRTRNIEAHACTRSEQAVLAHDITLTGQGKAGYILNLRLLSAEPLPVSTH